METSCSSVASSISTVGGSLKLSINKNDKLRRIAISRLLRDKNDVESISIELLKKYAMSYSGLKPKEEKFDAVVTKATYLDEDGDCIEISTDEELADAIMFVDELNRSTNNRASSLLTIHLEVQSVQMEEKDIKETQNEEKNIPQEKLDLAPKVAEKSDSFSQTYYDNDSSQVDNSLPNNEVSTSQVEEEATLATKTENNIEHEESESQQPRTKARIFRRPQRQRRHCRNRRYKHRQKNVPPPVKAAVDTVLDFVNDTVDTITAGLSPYPASTHYTQTVFDPNFVHVRHTCDGCGTSPILGYRYHATNIPDFDLCLPCKTKCILPDISFIQAQDGAINMAPSPQHEGFDSNFVHSRHTCDGCGISPIVGYRWHSTNIANYDLCDGCKTNSMSTDITFQLQQIEADRAYPRSNPIPPANEVRNDEEDCLSSDLQKALQLSFEESKASEEKAAEDHIDAATDAESKTINDNEPLVLSASEALEFLVPSVNDIFGENKNKSTPKIIENDSFSDAGTQTDIALISSTEDNSTQTDEEKIVIEDEDDDIEDSFTSVEKEDSKFTSDDVDMEELSVKKGEGRKDNTEGDDEWAMVEDETDFEAIGSSLFRQGLSSS